MWAAIWRLLRYERILTRLYAEHADGNGEPSPETYEGFKRQAWAEATAEAARRRLKVVRDH